MLALERCPNCPPEGRRCFKCTPNGFRDKPLTGLSAGVVHRRETVVKEVDSELFSCPGCMRKMRGSWRYCSRCEGRYERPKP